MTGAAITVLALAEPFIAAGAAVAFWFFFATEKELSPRGYERNENMNAWWVTPSIREINYLVFDFLNRYARVILNKMKELSFMKGNLFYPLIAAGVASVFCLETKGTKSSRKNDASTAQGKTPGPPFFHPTALEL